jgi:hypothetical protein
LKKYLIWEKMPHDPIKKKHDQFPHCRNAKHPNTRSKEFFYIGLALVGKDIVF